MKSLVYDANEIGICNASVCIVFVTRTLGIVFNNQSASAITDHSRSTKNLVPNFKSQFHVGENSAIMSTQLKLISNMGRIQIRNL